MMKAVVLMPNLSLTPPPAPRWFGRLRRLGAILLTLAGAGLILAGTTFVGGTLLEEQDAFCAACHTVPEETYFNRATTALTDPSAPVTDLSTRHYDLAQASDVRFQCISCHRGTSTLEDRVQTLALGLRDTLIFVSGQADPTIEKTRVDQAALVNSACISCHETTLLTYRDTQNHYHNLLPQTAKLLAAGRQMIGQNTGLPGPMGSVKITCTNCHPAHKTVDTSSPELKLTDAVLMKQSCDGCHALREQTSDD